MKDFLIVLYTPYQITVSTNTIYISFTYSGYRVIVYSVYRTDAVAIAAMDDRCCCG